MFYGIKLTHELLISCIHSIWQLLIPYQPNIHIMRAPHHYDYILCREIVESDFIVSCKDAHTSYITEQPTYHQCARSTLGVVNYEVLTPYTSRITFPRYVQHHPSSSIVYTLHPFLNYVVCCERTLSCRLSTRCDHQLNAHIMILACCRNTWPRDIVMCNPWL